VEEPPSTQTACRANIALGTAALDVCAVCDRNADVVVTVDEILLAVNHTLQGCG